MLQNKEIILASKSPRRKEILEKFGYQVEVVLPYNVDEVNLGQSGFNTPDKVVCHNSLLKARSVPASNKPILASDTIVMLGEKQFGKPEDKKEAISFLTLLAGKTHQVYSSYSIIHKGQEKTGFDLSHVTFKKLSEKEIMQYIETVHVLDKAGAYAIQDGGEIIVEKLEGSFYTVMGLPIEIVTKLLLN